MTIPRIFSKFMGFIVKQECRTQLQSNYQSLELSKNKHSNVLSLEAQISELVTRQVDVFTYKNA